jgi:hypothetical protein
MRTVEPKIAVAERSGQRQRLRRAAGRLDVNALVVNADGVDRACVDGVPAAAVLVRHRPRVETGRRDVFDRAVRAAPDDDLAAHLGRPAFSPVDVVAVDARLLQRDAARHGHVDRDGRLPRSVGLDTRFRHSFLRAIE